MITTQAQILNSLPPALRDLREREIIDKVWNSWFDREDEHELEEYERLRWQFAPKEPCSVTRLVRACQRNINLARQLPHSLRVGLQEADVLPVLN